MITLSPDVQARAERIKLLIMDVDGVLTNGHIYIRDNGEEIKSFHTLDGHGLKMLQQSGVQTAIITGRDAPSVGIRVEQLGINHYYKGILRLVRIERHFFDIQLADAPEPGAQAAQADSQYQGKKPAAAPFFNHLIYSFKAASSVPCACIIRSHSSRTAPLPALLRVI